MSRSTVQASLKVTRFGIAAELPQKFSFTAVEATPTPMTVPDFNGDGIPDLVFGGFVYLGNGDGTFRGVWLGQIGFGAVGDFNGDGKLDVAITDVLYGLEDYVSIAQLAKTMALHGTRKGGAETCVPRVPSVRCCPQGRQWRTSRAAARRSYRSSSSREPLQTRAVLGRLDYRAERRRSTVWSQFVDTLKQPMARLWP